MNLGRSIFAGLVGTAVMTALILVAPMVGMPEMNIGAMLAGFLGTSMTIGWITHFVIGSTLAVIYAALFATRLPGGPVRRGVIYGVLVFFVAQLVATPVMGGAVFSGSDLAMITGSLIGHVVYGGVVGTVYGTRTWYTRSRSSPARRCTTRRKTSGALRATTPIPLPPPTASAFPGGWTLTALMAEAVARRSKLGRRPDRAVLRNQLPPAAATVALRGSTVY